MSYLANYKLIVQINFLLNIYMRRQGFAAIMIQLIDESGPNINYGIPYGIYFPSKFDKRIENSATIHQNAFKSSTFPIQYLDQKYNLNQTVEFDLSVPVDLKQKNENIALKFTLLFDRLLTYNGTLNPNNHSIQTVVMKLKSIQSGIFHYAQGFFVGEYYSKFGFTCFCIGTGFTFKPTQQITIKTLKNKENTMKKKKLQRLKSFGEYLSWYEKFQLQQESGLQYFYEKYGKNLRYNSQLLKIRVNQHYKHRRETIFKLPKFIKQISTEVSQKQFFLAYAKFNSSKLTIEGYEQEIIMMKQQNEEFAKQVAIGLKNDMFNTHMLVQEFMKYDMQMKNWRMSKSIEFGNNQYEQAGGSGDRIQKMKKFRKEQMHQNSYPIEIQKSNKQIYIDYNVWYSPLIAIKHRESLRNKLDYPYDESKMIVVLCHGYQSSAADMRTIKLGISLALPLASLLVSKQNQIYTQDSIEQMGERLANQILSYIKMNSIDTKEMILSFVGFSMGGVIARASLKFGFYCSIGSPHLGYLNGGVTKAGLWFIRNFVDKNCVSLDQLSMTDVQHPQETFLFRLSSSGSLKKFKKVILISSAEDKYVPWHSARICKYKKKKANFQLQYEMIDNIIGGMTTHRIDINFGMQKNDVNRMLGRKAHINMLTDYKMFDLINAAIPKLFDIRQL